jgi:ABC-2 type transport system ATP-binding protein
LEQIVDKFSGEKEVTLQLSDERSLDSLKRLPNVLEVEAPKIRFRVARDDVGRVLSEILSSHPVDDIVVEDPPLEEVISNVFSEAEKSREDKVQGVAN